MAYIYEGADAAADITTTYTINVGDFFIGSASSTNGTYNDDWIRITLAANTTYTVSMNSLGLFGVGLDDPYLEGYDSAGNVISGAFNEDGGPGNYSQLTFTTVAAGTYYIAAGAYTFTNGGPFINDSGQYILTMTEGNKASFDFNMGASALYRDEASWSATAGTAVNVTFAIAGTGAAFDASGNATPFITLTAAQIAAAQQALALYSDVCGVSFTQINPGGTSENATILFNAYSANDSAGAYAYFPGSTASNNNAGNVSLNNTSVSTTSLPFGSYDFFAIMHEIGHAMGLAHPGDYNAAPGVNITYAANAQFIQDSQQYTVMSYFSASDTGANLGGFSDTLMLYDVFALHQLYGANTSTRSGATVYGFNSNAGAVYNFAINTDPGVCIWDGGGIDMIDLSGWSMNQDISLEQGRFSSVGGLSQNLSIAFGAVIENAIGGSGNDSITGNGANNTLNGKAGSDTIFGGGGLDTIYGGGGNDIICGGVATGDPLDAADTIYGHNGNDIIYGNAGYDTIFGGEGLDTIYGGGGNDTICGGAATGDPLDAADTIYGNGGNDTIYGNGGDDVICGEGGFDTLYGGAGADRFVFDTALNAGTNVDTIIGFTVNSDDIVLSRAIFTQIGTGLDGFEFQLGTGANDTGDRVIYNPANGQLFFDADGLGGAAQTLFATVTAGTALTINDFIMIA